MICTGCGCTQTMEELKAEHPHAVSCCPERVMVDATGYYEGLAAGFRMSADALRQMKLFQFMKHPVGAFAGAAEILDKMAEAAIPNA